MNHSINQLNQSNKEYDGLQSWTNLTENLDSIHPPPPHPPDQGCENDGFRFRTALIRPVLWNCDDHDDVSVSVLWTQDNQTNKQTNKHRDSKTGEKLSLKKILLIITVKLYSTVNLYYV